MTATVYEIRARRRRLRAGLRRARRIRLAVAIGAAGMLALGGTAVAAAQGGIPRPIIIFRPTGQVKVPGGFPPGGTLTPVPGGSVWEEPGTPVTIWPPIWVKSPPTPMPPPPPPVVPWAAG